MKLTQNYVAYSPDIDCPPFPASVPGNVQLDYITAHPEFVSDINYGEEFRKMFALEPYTWYYRTVLDKTAECGKKLWFVTEGIDYIWTLIADGKEFYTHEGMFSRVELCLTDILGDALHDGTVFEIKIHPHPMLEGMPVDRNQASQCVKPPVAYEWDWHPRVIPSGLWDETYFEFRDENHIFDAEVRYTLSDDFSKADVSVTVKSEVPADVSVYSPEGDEIFKGRTTVDNGCLKFAIENPELWWCRGMGDAKLYSYTVKTAGDERKGTFGIRRVKLVMNEGAWNEPSTFPKSRSYPPAQINLNGVNVFAKGSNYVNQEIFTGTMTYEKYEKLIVMAVEANMNIFRCWGGTGIQKDDFYSLCDKYGIMLWVEFPLACNNYYDSEHYLSVLRSEAAAIILKLRRHPSLTIWCGGNELFNNWSLMTDQHLALRLLNALTYELTPEIPYNMTSPLSGMKHGGYTFIDGQTGLDQFALFSRTKGTAYTEFGIPGIASAELIREIIPEDELFPPKPGGAWEAHHAFNAWGSASWLCIDTLERFGDISTLEKMVETSQRLQMMGYKAIFEEARRQKPYCAMAVNWCWCEPWKCAVNNSLIAYPDVKKSGYFAVRDSLRDVVGSLKMTSYSFDAGETFVCEPWLLNDTRKSAGGTIKVTAELCGTTYDLGETVLNAPALTNAHGEPMTLEIPEDTPHKAQLNLVCALTTTDGEVIENRYSMFINGVKNA